MIVCCEIGFENADVVANEWTSFGYIVGRK